MYTILLYWTCPRKTLLDDNFAKEPDSRDSARSDQTTRTHSTSIWYQAGLGECFNRVIWYYSQADTVGIRTGIAGLWLGGKRATDMGL